MRAVEGYFAPAEILGENGMTETRSKRHPPSEIERIHHILQYGGRFDLIHCLTSIDLLNIFFNNTVMHCKITMQIIHYITYVA